MKKSRGAEIKNDILRTLREDSPDFSSGEKMSGVFGLSRAGLWKHIESLRKEGYVIESFPRKGYRLKKVPDKLTGEVISSGLKTGLFGRSEIYCFDSVASTNEVAYSFASEGAKEGTIVAAETQTKGRGRMGRVWISPSGGGLYFSIILRPEIRIDETPAVTLVAAASIAGTIREVSGLDARVKWPNDIFIGRRKVCGILAETRAHPDRTDFLVLGIGINVNTSAGKLPGEATSIKGETGKNMDRVSFLRSVLENLERSYLLFVENGFSVFRDELRDMSNVIGKVVSIETNRSVVNGKAVDIDERGALMVRDAEGNVHSIFSGDVVLPLDGGLWEAAEE